MPITKVLIVEDSEIIQQRLMDRLAPFTDLEVIGLIQHATEAEKSIRTLKPEILILDIRLRSGNGIDVLEKIKDDAVRPVVIVITNFPHPQYRKKCLEAGADHVLDKSSEFEKIPQIIEKLIQKRGSHVQ
jgi:DNA-binding NarL/FixJ family response regulator